MHGRSHRQAPAKSHAVFDQIAPGVVTARARIGATGFKVETRVEVWPGKTSVARLVIRHD